MVNKLSLNYHSRVTIVFLIMSKWVLMAGGVAMTYEQRCAHGGRGRSGDWGDSGPPIGTRSEPWRRPFGVDRGPACGQSAWIVSRARPFGVDCGPGGAPHPVWIAGSDAALGWWIANADACLRCESRVGGAALSCV